ncbi:hypothetical protein [Streptomyces sp. SYSU K21746]
MIPASHPYEARYRHDGHVRPYVTTKPVIAWGDDGVALVADEKTGRLREASSYSNFSGVAPADAEVVGAVPGGTWRAEFSTDEEGTVSWPVLAWLVRSDGECSPVYADRDGLTDSPLAVGNFVRLYQPEEDPDDAA